MELRQYVDILRRRWRVVTVPALIAASAAAAITLTGPVSYRSTTTLFYSSSDPAVGNSPVDQRLQSYVTLVKSPRVAQAVIKQLGLTLPVPAVQASLSASASADTLLLDVTASDSSAQRSQQLSAAAAGQLITLVATLEPRATSVLPGAVPNGAAANGAADGGAGSAVTVSPATPSLAVAQQATPAVSTRVDTAVRGVLLALVLGLLLGVVAALVAESLDDGVRSSRQLRDDEQLRTLASIPLDPAKGTVGALMHDHRGPWAESFRRLRTRLFPIGQATPRTVVITGCLPQAGTTTVTCALGITLARVGLRVVIVGADLRHPALAGQLWIRSGSGLTEVLEEKVSLDEALQPRGDGLLTVLPAGSSPPNPGELLGSDAMGKLLATLESRFDLVLIEAPPVIRFADAVIISGVAGCGALLVVRYGRTGREQVQDAVRLLEESGVAIHGAVLTMVPGEAAATGATNRLAARRARRRADIVLEPDLDADPIPVRPAPADAG
ncbi:MAG TPA: CpsD/CapB family tyrosine-protein kinase [Kineosporiaceae bacterium]|nr:CpsD/CapB family tyrosine-protein kinase [Kineosporiaceae bacterium]